MNRMMRAAAVAAAATGGLGSVGCVTTGTGPGDRYRNAVDPCWPERYNHVARAEALAPFQAQAANGATLDLTVWNYHFEPGGDRLTPAGLEKLNYLVQRRPAPDARVYLQTTRDIAYDPAAPEKYADTRRDLDQRRAKAVQNYLAAQTAGRPMTFEVQVIDAADPGFGAQYPANAVRVLPALYTPRLGLLGGGGGGGGGSGGGGGGGGSGGGGGTGGGGGR